MSTATITAPVTVQPSDNRIVNTRMTELDGIRGIAILLVLLFHCGTFNSTTAFSRLLRLVTGVSLGWSGVDLFFVLSGFLITGILLDTKKSEKYFSSFYMRRVLRIFPLYMAFVLVFFWVAVPIAHALGHGSLVTSSAQKWYWLYLSNWRVGLGFTRENYLNHFWSLAIEEQFYVLWPLIVLMLSESQLLKLCFAVISSCLILRCSLVSVLHPPILQFLTPFRIDTLAFGAVACLIFRNTDWARRYRAYSRRILAALGLSLVVLVTFCGAVSFEHVAIRTVGYTLFAAFYGCLVFGAASASRSPGLLVMQLRRPALLSLGKYSYAIYVVHLPVYIVVRNLLNRASEYWKRDYDAVFALCSVLTCLVVSYAFARLSWKLLEEPFLRMKAHFPYCS